MDPRGARPSAIRRRTGRSAGFTLVEVLVALAIAATALMAGVRAMAAMAQSQTELRWRLLAQMSAENRVALRLATGAFPDEGTTTAPCPQGNLALVCEEVVAATPNIAFRRLSVRVSRAQAPGHALAELVAVLPRPDA